MARLFDDASTEYLEYSGVILTAVPITMACWFRTDVASLFQALVSITDPDAGSQQHFTLSILGATQKVKATTGPYGVSTTTTISADTWHHACGVFAASNDRRVYLDGGGKGTYDDDMTPTNIDVTTIGIRKSLSTTYEPLSGSICEVGIWNVALTDDEVAILAKGYSPVLVHPQNLVAYWPLIRTEDQDRVGGYDMTPINAPSVGEHVPKVMYPAPVQLFGVKSLIPPALLVDRSSTNYDNWTRGVRIR